MPLWHAGGQRFESAWLHTLKPLHWKGFLVFGGIRPALSHACLGRFLGRFRAKNLGANGINDALLSIALAI